MPGIRQMVRTLCDGMAKEFGEGRNYEEILDRYADAYETLTERKLTMSTVARACNRTENQERMKQLEDIKRKRVGDMVMNQGMNVAQAAKVLRISNSEASNRLREYKEGVGLPTKKDEKTVKMEEVRKFRDESNVGDKFRAIITKEEYDEEMRRIKIAEEKEVEIKARYTFVADTSVGVLTWTALYLAIRKYYEKYREAANV